MNNMTAITVKALRRIIISSFNEGSAILKESGIIKSMLNSPIIIVKALISFNETENWYLSKAPFSTAALFTAEVPSEVVTIYIIILLFPVVILS